MGCIATVAVEQLVIARVGPISSVAAAVVRLAVAVGLTGYYGQRDWMSCSPQQAWYQIAISPPVLA